MVYQSSHPQDKSAQIHPPTPKNFHAEKLLPFHPPDPSIRHQYNPSIPEIPPHCVFIVFSEWHLHHRHCLHCSPGPNPHKCSPSHQRRPYRRLTRPSRLRMVRGRLGSLNVQRQCPKNVGMDAFPGRSEMREYEKICRGKRRMR